jgi:hypothetical protein
MFYVRHLVMVISGISSKLQERWDILANAIILLSSQSLLLVHMWAFILGFMTRVIWK